MFDSNVYTSVDINHFWGIQEEHQQKTTLTHSRLLAKIQHTCTIKSVHFIFLSNVIYFQHNQAGGFYFIFVYTGSLVCSHVGPIYRGAGCYVPCVYWEICYFQYIELKMDKNSLIFYLLFRNKCAMWILKISLLSAIWKKIFKEMKGMCYTRTSYEECHIHITFIVKKRGGGTHSGISESDP